MAKAFDEMDKDGNCDMIKLLMWTRSIVLNNLACGNIKECKGTLVEIEDLLNNVLSKGVPFYTMIRGSNGAWTLLSSWKIILGALWALSAANRSYQIKKSKSLNEQSMSLIQGRVYAMVHSFIDIWK